MTWSRFAALALGLALALPGCGKNEPPKSEPDKAKDKGKPDSGHGTTQSGTANSGTTSGAPAEVRPTDPSQTAAEKFVREFRDGAVKPDELSTAFLKVVGKPIGPFDADKARGYSTDEAAAWLRAVRGGLGSDAPNFGIPTGYAQGGVAVFAGTFQPKERGHYRLRLAQDGGAWKLDWLQVANIPADEPRKPQTADEPFQDFAARAFLDAVTDKGVMPPDARVRLVGALLSPRYRTALGADPGNQDKGQGYDYNPGWLKPKMAELGGGADSYTCAPAGPAAFRVEFTKGGAKSGHVLRLVRGPVAGSWLVDEFAPQP
jgi:hypothetical protein